MTTLSLLAYTLMECFCIKIIDQACQVSFLSKLNRTLILMMKKMLRLFTYPKKDVALAEVENGGWQTA